MCAEPDAGGNGRPPLIWLPPAPGRAIPWSRIEASLRVAARWPDPHRLDPRLPQSARRAAVAVLLRGDRTGAREVILVQRGHGAPQHAGELAFPGGMVEPGDRDLPATARRELFEELGLGSGLWELGCFPDGLAKALTRFTPVLLRWEPQEDTVLMPGPEIHGVLPLPLEGLLEAPWTLEVLDRGGLAFVAPRLELAVAPLWGATARVLKAWLDVLAACP
jgi:8-oxo-dGTP pyrophosphatase MutT (NUDIX family)